MRNGPPSSSIQYHDPCLVELSECEEDNIESNDIEPDGQLSDISSDPELDGERAPSPYKQPKHCKRYETKIHIGHSDNRLKFDGTKVYRIPAILDSGTDRSWITRSLLKDLGVPEERIYPIRPEHWKRCHTIAGAFDARYYVSLWYKCDDLQQAWERHQFHVFEADGEIVCFNRQHISDKGWVSSVLSNDWGEEEEGSDPTSPAYAEWHGKPKKGKRN